MRLLRAAFQNFRLLRDLELDFGIDPEKRLTIVRAANESGKTTVLLGLQWVLYGDEALPARGEGFRLHPIDWDVSEGALVTITASVDFEVTTHRQVAGRTRETRKTYRLVRSTIEDVQDEARRPPSAAKLFELQPAGARPIEAPEAVIRDELPPELREVFFTDGDRALSFIEADVAVSTKRDRVQRAIRSLLGLGVIEAALKHVRKTKAEMNRKARSLDRGGRLSVITSLLDEIERKETCLSQELSDAKQQFHAFDERVDATDRKIRAALQKGNRVQLARELQSVQSDMDRLDKETAAAADSHSRLFRGRAVALDFVAPLLQAATAKLDELRQRGKIPNTTIPVLEDRLAAGVCICGESLDSHNPAGRDRRTHVESLIEQSRRVDEVQRAITDLYYGAKQLSGIDGPREPNWREAYRNVVGKRDTLETLREEAGRKYRALEAKLQEIPNTDIQGLTEAQRQFKAQRDKFMSKHASIETRLTVLQRERGSAERERASLLRAKKKGGRILAGLDVTGDVETVLQSAFQHITNEELAKVSERMNEIFLEMIGADPRQGAIIRRTEVSRDFDILVYGPSDKTLNPDRDLNGASRRALTLAFILALTKVSGVEAPNVIDTPLGMTSGYVKRAILTTAVRESTQLVLFLTQDEISGCEDIIDETASVVFTLTNPAHYPKMLMNDPCVEERKVVRCECDHRRSCRLCERRLDAHVEPETMSQEAYIV